MRTRAGSLLLALLLASCAPAPSLHTQSSPAGPAATGETASPQPSPVATQAGAAGYVLIELTTSTSGDRHTDLVALDLATGALLLAPWMAAEGWDLGAARWSPDGAALLLGQRVAGVEPPVLEWSEQWLDPARPARPIQFDAERVVDVAASLPEGAWFSGTAYDEDGPHHTVFRHADGSGADGRGPTGQLAWSPVSREAVILTRDDRLVLVEPQTLTMRTLAESARFLSQRVNDPHVLWSPDGREILYRADPCGLCIQNLASGAVRTLDTSSAGDVFEAHAWTPLGVVATLDETDQVALLSAESGDVSRVLGTIVDPAVAPSLDRVIGFTLEPGATNLTIVTIDLATGTKQRYTTPEGTFLWHPRWQPVLVEVPWPPWTPPGPEATPTIAAGLLELEVEGAFTATTSLAAACESRDPGLAISGSDGTIGAQLGVSDGGTPTFLSVDGPGFAAFAGKGFEVAPPFVVAEPGSTPASGTLSFNALPNIDAAGVISGTLRWTCPSP